MLALIQEVLEEGRRQNFPMTRLVANMEWALEDRPVQPLCADPQRAHGRGEGAHRCSQAQAESSATGFARQQRRQPLEERRLVVG